MIGIAGPVISLRSEAAICSAQAQQVPLKPMPQHGFARCPKSYMGALDEEYDGLILGLSHFCER
jgi:hypothetical protein